MKKLELTNGGHRRYYNDDVTHLNEAIVETANAFAKLLGDNVYLTDTLLTTAAGFTSCDAGAMIYKGELCYFDAQNIAEVAGQFPAWVPDTTYRALDPITYADASNQSPHVIKKVVLQYVDIGSPPADYKLANEVAFRSVALQQIGHGEWLEIGTNDINLAANVSLDDPNSSDDHNAYVRHNLGTRDLWMKGRLFYSNAVVDGTSYLLFTLPLLMRPVKKRLSVAMQYGNDYRVITYLEVRSNGEVWFTAGVDAANAVINLDDIRISF